MTTAAKPARAITRPIRFSDLAIGARFRFLWCRRLKPYYKTGDESYGACPGEPQWEWTESFQIVEQLL
jgi:hypothetical protein